jgi:septum formation protein
MFNAQANPTIVLASSSPRRSDLLKSAGISFIIQKPDVEEVRQPNERATDYCRRNARSKAEWCAAHSPHNPAVFVSADTIVCLGNEVFEKPTDDQHAFQMLSKLSGQTHEVLTAVHIIGKLQQQQKSHAFLQSTKVTFKDLHPDEIRHYIQTGEAKDKSGSYAAQGAAGYLISHIDGSYSNVIGLPVTDVLACLETEFSFYRWPTKN